MTQKVRQLKNVRSAKLRVDRWEVDPMTDHNSHRRRDTRLDGLRGEDERPIRRHAESITRHNEQNAADGGKDGHWMEDMARLLRLSDIAVLVH